MEYCLDLSYSLTIDGKTGYETFFSLSNADSHVILELPTATEWLGTHTARFQVLTEADTVAFEQTFAVVIDGKRCDELTLIAGSEIEPMQFDLGL